MPTMLYRLAGLGRNRLDLPNDDQPPAKNIVPQTCPSLYD